jgi:beta-galactosidase
MRGIQMNNISSRSDLEMRIPLAAPSLIPLRMGGKNPQGEIIAVNNHYLTLNNRPWIPIMGEFHFSRYPQRDWENELLKMKAGGINVIATYIFWIHVEEIEGVFDWAGSNNLRLFIELCAKHNLYAYPRIGPWAHGECRNGGFPDWLLEKCGRQVRQDTPLYLTYARRLYHQISRQLQGLLWKDGGPIIGIQIENELLDNAPHIATLKKMAIEAGLDVPIYTMTGWGPADVPDGEVIPVFGGYPDAFWDRHIDSWARNSRKHYFFSALRDDNTIGADLNKRAGLGDISYLEQYPHGTCEIGGGMQVSYHRRPVIEADDIAALAMVKIGNGSNMQGYYMYHGGTNPQGKRSTMQESQETGYPNDLPVIDYDFQAPIGKYGQIRESYHALRLLHLFLSDFGDQLAPFPTLLPASTPTSLDDSQTLRWSVRSDGRTGFLFINNYQRIETLPDKDSVQFRIVLAEETITIPETPVTIPSGAYTIWPINLDLNGVLLKYATAQPICNIDLPDGPLTVFIAVPGIESMFVFDSQSHTEITGATFPPENSDGLTIIRKQTPSSSELISISRHDGRKSHILVLNQSDARSLWKANVWGQDRLFLSSDCLLFYDGSIQIQTDKRDKTTFSVFPAPKEPLITSGAGIVSETSLFTHYAVPIQSRNLHVEAERLQPASTAKPVHIGPAGVAQAPQEADYETAEKWLVKLPTDWFDQVKEIFLRIEYTADAARAYLGRQLIDDDFYHGRTWEIGLSRFASQRENQDIILQFLPLHKDAPIYLPEEHQPLFDGEDQIVQVRNIGLRTLTELHIKKAQGPMGIP